jgi:hypothetical protein
MSEHDNSFSIIKKIKVPDTYNGDCTKLKG